MVKYSYSIWYTCETIRDKVKFETLKLKNTDTVLMCGYHINL
jgi:hypothetical protein